VVYAALISQLVLTMPENYITWLWDT